MALEEGVRKLWEMCMLKYIYLVRQENPQPDHVLWKSPKDIRFTEALENALLRDPWCH